MAANPSPLELIRPLVEYQALVGRRVTFVLLANHAGVDQTLIYALLLTEAEFETDQPLLRPTAASFTLPGARTT
jgi:hypothetical protein